MSEKQHSWSLINVAALNKTWTQAIPINTVTWRGGISWAVHPRPIHNEGPLRAGEKRTKIFSLYFIATFNGHWFLPKGAFDDVWRHFWFLIRRSTSSRVQASCLTSYNRRKRCSQEGITQPPKHIRSRVVFKTNLLLKRSKWLCWGAKRSVTWLFKDRCEMLGFAPMAVEIVRNNQISYLLSSRVHGDLKFSNWSKKRACNNSKQITRENYTIYIKIKAVSFSKDIYSSQVGMRIGFWLISSFLSF